MLEVFRLLTEEAKRQKEDFVFIGGSAVQSVVKNPRRLSIDLDAWYSGNPDDLMASLGSEYVVTPRKNVTDLFRFFTVTRKSDGVIVKVDFLRHPLLMQESPYGKQKMPSPDGSFTGYVASPDYLLASKLVALAVNTLGRRKKERFESDFIKDVLDANLLLDEFGLSEKVWPYFWGVCRVQNKFFQTTYTSADVVSDASGLLLQAAATTGDKLLISGQDFRNFGEYLLSGSLTKNDFSRLACRLAACLSFMQAFEGPNAVESFSRIEKFTEARYSERALLSKMEVDLMTKGLAADFLKSLKLLAPKALIYLHGATFPEEYSKNLGPVNTSTPGVSNPRH